jgi:hypothetical protein
MQESEGNAEYIINTQYKISDYTLLSFELGCTLVQSLKAAKNKRPTPIPCAAVEAGTIGVEAKSTSDH